MASYYVKPSKPSYDGNDPGPPGVYRFHEGNKVYLRRRDESAWRMARYQDNTLSQALAGGGIVKLGSDYLQMCTLIEYVADLEGNPVEPREARRIGDPPWNYSRGPEQLELF